MVLHQCYGIQGSQKVKPLKKKKILKNQAISSNRRGKEQGQSKSCMKKSPLICEENPFPFSAEKCSTTWRSNDSVDGSRLKWKWYKCRSQRNGRKQQVTKASPVFFKPYLAGRGRSGHLWVWARLTFLIRTLSVSGIFLTYIIFICFAYLFNCINIWNEQSLIRIVGKRSICQLNCFGTSSYKPSLIVFWGCWLTLIEGFLCKWEMKLY